MDGPMSGDIFPAKQAIEMIDQVDLSLPLEIPPVPADAEPDNVPHWLSKEGRANPNATRDRQRKHRDAWLARQQWEKDNAASE